MSDWILYIYTSSSRFSEVDEDRLDTSCAGHLYISSSRSSGVDEDGLDTSCAGHVYIYTYCPLDLVKWMRTDWILVVQDM